MAYVRENNIYVEHLADGKITQLTHDGTDPQRAATGAGAIINGTSDWVYEEELNLRDGFRWSPDGARIAYWQFDTTGVGIFSLIDDTSAAVPDHPTNSVPQSGHAQLGGSCWRGRRRRR